MVDYYSIRRVNPYLGVLQVVDTGEARAYSGNGRRWQVRKIENPGAATERSEWQETGAPRLVDPPVDMLAALERRPRVPFAPGDRYELWLLRRDGLTPLALLRTCRWAREMEPVRDPTWRSFLPGSGGFRIASLPQDLAPERHRDALERQVNLAARPRPVAQWFERHADGGGTGLVGMRVDDALNGRRLGADAFPELLVDERWDSARETAVVMAYHDWNAAALLAHQNLCHETRARLESAARRRPAPLLDTYPLIPEVLDPEAMKVALVTARLSRGQCT